MIVISMATESYANWLFHFLSSIGNQRACIFCINFSEKTLNAFKEEFPNIIFKKHHAELILHEKWNPLNKVFKVTHLKGLFMKKAYDEFKEDLVWIDCTELIRGDITELKGTFRFKREGNSNRSKTYAAIFGMNNQIIVDEYYKLCSEGNDWFIDQISLSKLNMNEIDKGEWISFNYDENAKSWSDRGKTGGGKITKEDYDYTEEKYIFDIEKKIKNYRNKYNLFKDKISKIRILVFTDDGVWCFINSVEKVISMLDDFEFTIIQNARRQYEEILNWNGDFVWSRCGSFRTGELIKIRPELKNRMFSSVTTGGECLLSRVQKNLANNHNELGMIVQNQEAMFMSKILLEKENRKMPIFILPNGCDINRFKPKEKDNFIVGWNGRATDGSIRTIKGFHYFNMAKDYLKLKTIELDGKNKIPFNDMSKFYDNISVLVLPTNSEGCSNTINEALSSGVPVITCKTGFHGEKCSKEDGVVFVNRNIKEIIREIIKFRDNPQYLKEMSAKALKWANKYSWENMAEHYRNTFNDMYSLVKHLPKLNKNTIKENKKIDYPNKKYINVKSINKCNLGKLEKNGPTLWFEKGMIRLVPYYDKYRDIINQHIEANFLEIVN